MKKVSLLIGGTKGIGFEIKKILNKENKIITINRSSENKDNIFCDLLDKKSIKDLVKKLKKYKIKNLIFAQRYRGGNDLDDYKLMISSPLYIIENLKNSFVENGSIVFIGSICTTKIALDQGAHYHSLRHGIVGMTKYLAYSLSKYKIRVNMVSTSRIIKKENYKFYTSDKIGRKIYNQHLKKIPLKKMLNSKDVANSIKFLINSDAKNLTGINIFVDGGEHLL